MNLDNNTSLAIMQAAQGNTVNALNATKQAVQDKNMEKFDIVAKDFEAMFMTEMMKPMFEGIKPDPRFGGGKGEEIFNGMMLQEYGKIIAETGQIGIAEVIKEELIRMQGEASQQPIVTKTANKNLEEIIQEQTNATQ